MIYPKLIKTFFALCLSLWLVVLGSSGLAAQQFPTDIVKVQTSRGVFTFKTEIAITDRQHWLGLMHRKQMARDAAMLFTWKVAGPVSMWMKDTYISLDIIFIRPNGQVANIARATTPLSLDDVSSRGYVNAVLEVIAGTADAIGLKAGDKVFLPAKK